MNEDSLKKRYSAKLFANIINGVVHAFLIAIVPKALGPIAYGQFVYLQEFFKNAVGFLDMGSSLAFFSKLSARNNRKELIAFYFLYSFVVLCMLVGFIFIVDSSGYSDYMLPGVPNEYIYFGLFFGFFTWFTQIFIKISDAYAITVPVELLKIGHKIGSLLLLLCFIRFTSFNLNNYFTFHYIALMSFIAILTWLFIKKNILKGIFNSQFSILKLSKEFINYCHQLLVYSTVGLMAGMLDIWILQKTAGSEQTGYYGLAYSLAAICFFFTSAMTPIIIREFSKSYEERDLETMRKHFYRYIPMLYSVAAFFAVFLSVNSENVLIIFTQEQFQGATSVLVIMSLYPIHQTYGQLSGSIFYATGQTKLLRNIALVVMTFGMGISFGMIYIFDLGAVGLAFKMVIMQFIWVITQLYFNSMLLNMDMKYFIFHQIYSLVFFAILAVLSSSIVSNELIWVNFLFSGVLYTLFVIICSYIFPQIFATNRDEIKQSFNNIYLKIRK